MSKIVLWDYVLPVPLVLTPTRYGSTSIVDGDYVTGTGGFTNQGAIAPTSQARMALYVNWEYASADNNRPVSDRAIVRLRKSGGSLLGLQATFEILNTWAWPISARLACARNGNQTLSKGGDAQEFLYAPPDDDLIGWEYAFIGEYPKPTTTLTIYGLGVQVEDRWP